MCTGFSHGRSATTLVRVPTHPGPAEQQENQQYNENDADETEPSAAIIFPPITMIAAAEKQQKDHDDDKQAHLEFLRRSFDTAIPQPGSDRPSGIKR